MNPAGRSVLVFSTKRRPYGRHLAHVVIVLTKVLAANGSARWLPLAPAARGQRIHTYFVSGKCILLVPDFISIHTLRQATVGRDWALRSLTLVQKMTILNPNLILIMHDLSDVNLTKYSWGLRISHCGFCDGTFAREPSQSLSNLCSDNLEAEKSQSCSDCCHLYSAAEVSGGSLHSD